MTLPNYIPQGLEDGRVRNLLDLEEQDFRIFDIAHRLAQLNRYCGALRWPLSVATHSVLVSHLVPAKLAMAGLLHDITETFGIGDVVSPIKRILGAPYREIEAAVHAQLVKPFPELKHAHADEVRWADERAYELECYQLRGSWPEHAQHRHLLDVREVHLCGVFLSREVSWRGSRKLFLDRYDELEAVARRHLS